MSFKNKNTSLILFCGLPGSGKTTLAKELEKERQAIRLCPDEWKTDLGLDFFDEESCLKVEASLWKLAKTLLNLGQDVILENGFWPRVERAELRDKAKALNVEIEIHYLDVPFKELMRRIEIRNASGDIYTVPLSEKHMQGYAKLFQAPDESELALYTRAITHKG
jgi:predicted kinase